MMPIETIALPANAHCMPPIAASSGAEPALINAAVFDDRIVTDIAVPMAPATCCVEPSSELACEYRCSGTALRLRVKTGVKMAAKPAMNATCADRMIQIDVDCPIW